MATVKDILAIANMKPKAIVKTTIAQYKEIGDSLTWEQITGVFKAYKALDNGNTKLAKGILSFSLLPVVTCNQECKGCYDVRSLRYPSVRLKRVVNTILASSRHASRLFETIKGQIERSKTVTAVRIHVGGDFFSTEYAFRWAALKLAVNKSINWYTYTKTSHTEVLVQSGINVVESKLDNGQFNFGPKVDIMAMAKSRKGFVCPATMGKVKDQFCGSGCKACQTRKDVFFVIH